MRPSTRVLTAALALGTAMGCASGFSRIAPGMTSAEVNELVGRGPSSAREFKDGSVAWFYGTNQCIRLRDDRVVAKEVTESRGGLNTQWVGVQDVRKAQCAPEGEEVDSGQLNVYTPFGTFSAPTSAVKEASDQVTGQGKPQGQGTHQGTEGNGGGGL